MRVFIENEAGKAIKNIFDEKTLEFKKSVEVSRPYPFPYGFVLNTTSGDGDNLDVFVLTNQPLESKQVIEATPVGLLEMHEDGEVDHKILAIIPDQLYEITDEVVATLKDFITHVFDHLPDKNIELGDILPAEAALRFMEETAD